VDHDVELAGQVGTASREVAVDDLDALVEEAEQRLVRAEPFAERVERGLARQVVDPFDRCRARLGSHEHDDPRAGDVGQQPLEEDLAQEPGDAGQQDPRAGEPIGDRRAEGSGDGRVGLYHSSDYRLSTGR
jgi:hypothetical protein